MTRVLIIQGHPDPVGGHLCHAIADAYRTEAVAAGHDVQLIDVARETVPILRTRADWEGTDLPTVARDGQTAVNAAQHLVLIYPLWMGDMPALLKAWIEQVFRHGFAFEMTDDGWRPGLKGRSARVIVTMGMPGLVYRWFYMAHSLRSLVRNILKFCGIRPVRTSVFGSVEAETGRVQARILKSARALGRRAA